MAAKLIDNYTTPTVTSTAVINFSTASASFVAVTGASLTLVNQRGRPVLVALLPSPTSGLIGSVSTVNTNDLELEILRGATVLSISKQTASTGAGGAMTLEMSPSLYWVLDNPGIGSFVYTVQIRRITAGNTATVTNAVLSAYEL